MPSYQAIIIGAGPGGLATILALLDAGLKEVLWVDERFGGGRLNELYREISSNTKVGIYLDAIDSFSTSRGIVDAAPSPNAVDELESIDREETCQLSLAGDMIRLLEAGVLGKEGVEKCSGRVEEARYEDSQWHVSLPGHTSTSPRLFLCTGSHPFVPSFHQPIAPHLTVLDLDQCMLKSALPSLFPPDQQSTVGVIGNSHSGILCCRNLYETAQEGKRKLKMLNFRRRGIRYAEYREDGIVYDNTGLKGDTAVWAKDIMEHDPDPSILEQIDLCPRSAEGDDTSDEQKRKYEEEVYRRQLPRCTHLVYAVGYASNAYPRLFLNGDRIDGEIQFDQQTSGFKLDGNEVPRLYGLGIAHPEMTEDPEGNVEAAVGVAKFFKFAQRVKEDWAKLN